MTVHSLLNTLGPSTSTRKKPLSPEPTVCSPLPQFSKLEGDAASEARQAHHKHLIQEAVNSPLELPQDAQFAPSPDLTHSNTTLDSNVTIGGKGATGGKKGGGHYEQWEVARAIEKKDVMSLMEIKQNQFDLLISGTPLPVVYAMRLGKSHQDIAILLIGAMSRKVNDVTDDEIAMMNSQTKSTLRALRASLKIAINASLSSSDTSLISSFLQVVVMSEGTRWLLSSTQQLSLAFRTGPSAKPISQAEKVMYSWVSRELKERQVSAVEEYTSNGVWDLGLLGVWSVVQDQTGEGEALPLWYFGRDDRMLKAVEERMAVMKRTGVWTKKVSKGIRQQVETMLEVLGHREVNGRERVEMLKDQLDAKE